MTTWAGTTKSSAPTWAYTDKTDGATTQYELAIGSTYRLKIGSGFFLRIQPTAGASTSWSATAKS